MCSLTLISASCSFLGRRPNRNDLVDSVAEVATTIGLELTGVHLGPGVRAA